MAAGAFKDVPEIPTKGYGQGLVKGLAVTLRTMLKPAITRPYPHTKPDLPARTRGVIALKQENCTVCYKCARECPDWCIYIDAHKETHPPAGGGKARSAKILDRFDIDFSLCMYCGICVEVCPFDALFWSPEFEYAEYDIRNMLHDMEKLEDWTYTVLPPPPIDDGAEEPPGEPDAAAGAGSPATPAAAPPAPVAPTSVAPGDAPVAPAGAPEATPAPPAPPPTTDATGAAVAAGAPAGASASATPSTERHEVAMDQETYQAKLKELLDQGVSARVAEGQARRAGMIAARKKAAGEG